MTQITMKNMHKTLPKMDMDIRIINDVLSSLDKLLNANLDDIVSGWSVVYKNLYAELDLTVHLDTPGTAYIDVTVEYPVDGPEPIAYVFTAKYVDDEFASMLRGPKEKRLTCLDDLIDVLHKSELAVL